jgi:hypothetical protein
VPSDPGNVSSFFPGSRVAVFDPRLYVNDVKTPLSVTAQPATVVRWYGYISKHCGRYESVIDVTFDYDGRESHGHFTSGARHAR